MAMGQPGELVGQIIPRTFNAGFIVLSCVVSYVGSLTTLELLSRRTAGSGRQNWFLLVAGAISMGGVAIWSMHFLGNRAIILGTDDRSFQIVYSSGYTALSFFVPVLVLLGAFFALGADEKAGIVRVLAAGTLAGLAVCGMHYVGQLGISNFSAEYDIGHVVGSVIVAIVAANAALTIFFLVNSVFANTWLQRSGVGALLAGAVSAMHWTASTGTTYRLVQDKGFDGESLSRNTVVIIVSVFALIACVTLIVFAILAQRRRALQADRAQQVVLACAYFDQDGRLMVTPEGQLVNVKITKAYLERSFDEVFGEGHPVFRWIYQATRNWASVADLIPAMRQHLRGSPRSGTSLSKSPRYTSVHDQIDDSLDYSIVFRELFCLAAADLADQLNEPIERLGVLYDRIVKTGTTSKVEVKERISSTPKQSSIPLGEEDIEMGCRCPPIIFGRGQMLFMSRAVDRKDQAKLQAQGFRFAPPQHVLDIMSQALQVEKPLLAQRLDCMEKFCRTEALSDSGVHIGCFGVRAALRGGFEVLVRSDARCQLPAIRLPYSKLTAAQFEFLRELHGMTVNGMLGHLQYSAPPTTEAMQEFSTNLLEAVGALAQRLTPSNGGNVELFNQEARFISTPVTIPCQYHGPEDVRFPGPDSATLFAFKIVFPIHVRAPSNRLEFRPLSFFRTQQHSFIGCLDLQVFARTVHREFSAVLDVSHPHSDSVDEKYERTKGIHADRKISFWNSLQSPTPPPSSRALSTAGGGYLPTYGGIMVSQTITVEIEDGKTDLAADGKTIEVIRPAKGVAEGIDERNGVTKAQVEALREEGETSIFVDDLLAQCFDGT